MTVIFITESIAGDYKANGDRSISYRLKNGVNWAFIERPQFTITRKPQ